MTNLKFKIRHEYLRDHDDGNILFWSNSLGWVDESSADVFSFMETKKLHLPIEGRWVKSS